MLKKMFLLWVVILLVAVLVLTPFSMGLAPDTTDVGGIKGTHISKGVISAPGDTILCNGGTSSGAGCGGG